ncbi:hypothetical protein [Moraxella ovis]|uniref:hypothetical protein n=1 Tax=Moraxella ovis TaxID=29433 RepID=UPI004039E1EA
MKRRHRQKISQFCIAPHAGACVETQYLNLIQKSYRDWNRQGNNSLDFLHLLFDLFFYFTGLFSKLMPVQ